jgi:hypothetical protein
MIKSNQIKTMDIENIQKVLLKPVKVEGFKRPLPRPRYKLNTPSAEPVEGVVRDIINLPKFCPPTPRPHIFQEKSEDYIRDLKKNYEYHGIPFKQPEIFELPLKYKVSPEPEKHIEYLDQIQVKLNVLKNGKVRVKMVLHGAQLYEKYYSLGKAPPLKALTTAYKNMGYSDEFIQAFNDKYKKRLVFGKKLDKILETIFDKSANTKKKVENEKKKKIPKDEHEEEEPEDDQEKDEDEDGPEEDEALVADDEEDEEEIIEDIDPDDFE